MFRRDFFPMMGASLGLWPCLLAHEPPAVPFPTPFQEMGDILISGICLKLAEAGTGCSRYHHRTRWVYNDPAMYRCRMVGFFCWVLADDDEEYTAAVDLPIKKILQTTDINMIKYHEICEGVAIMIDRQLKDTLVGYKRPKYETLEGLTFAIDQLGR